ncbi:MAG: hypothetical protein ACRD6W_07540, partial [Nitrososphaerales archaeon]
PLERLFTMEGALRDLAELHLLDQSQWLGSGKWLGRLLSAHDPQLAHRLRLAVDAAHDGEAGALIGMGREILEQTTGPVRSDWSDPEL